VGGIDWPPVSGALVRLAPGRRRGLIDLSTLGPPRSRFVWHLCERIPDRLSGGDAPAQTRQAHATPGACRKMQA